MNRFANSAAIWLAQRESGLLILIALIVTIVGCIDQTFLSSMVWTDILARSAPTAIVACGMMLIVVTGEIDISVGSQLAFTAFMMGRMLSLDQGAISPWIGVPATLFLGTCIGALIGCIVAWGKVPSIIVTLGALTILRGATTILLSGGNIDQLPLQLGELAKQGFGGMPLGVWIAGIVVAATQLIIHHTPLGRRLFAIGSSDAAARMAGLAVERLKVFAFAYTGFLTALATVVEIPRLPKIEAGIGVEFELLVITCVVVGGVSITGGHGRLTGVLLAVLLMTILRPVLTFLDVGESGEKWTRAIQGLFIMLAVIIDRISPRRFRRERNE